MRINCQDDAARWRRTTITSFRKHRHRNFVRNCNSTTHAVPLRDTFALSTLGKCGQALIIRPHLTRVVNWVLYWWLEVQYYLGRLRMGSFDAANPAARPRTVNTSSGQKINTSGPAFRVCVAARMSREIGVSAPPALRKKSWS